MANETKFTPGPYRRDIDAIYGPQGQRIASLHTRIQHSGSGSDDRPSSTFEEMFATGDLLSAAPALYEALVLARGLMPKPCDLPGCVYVDCEAKRANLALVDDALARARGEG